MSNFLRGESYQPGDRITSERLNLDQDAASSARGINAVGGFLKRYTGGMSITIPRYSRSTTSKTVQPFDIVTGPTAGSFYVIPGVVNNVMPINMFSLFTYATGLLQFLVADIDLANATVQGVTLSVTGNLSAPGAEMQIPPTGTTIGLAVLTGTKTSRLIGDGSIWLKTVISLVEAITASPGDPPYNEYYTYSL